MLRWLRAFAFDWLLIIVAISAVECWPGLLTGFTAILLIGTRQHALAVLAHDGAHGSICSNRQLNDTLARLCFMPFGISLVRYRKFHFAHHRFLIVPSMDPERALKAKAAPAWDLPASRQRILCLAARDFLIWPALREVMPFMAIVASLRATLAAVAIWMTVALMLGWMPVALWFAALSTSFWASNRLRIWTEHQGTNGTWCVSATWWQRFLFLPHNIGWHMEHHGSAGTAFWKLPGLRSQEPMSVGELFETLRASATPSPRCDFMES